MDGETALPLVAAQDHKAVFDGDKGPNTGGMGAYSPAPVVTPELTAQVMERIIRPTVRAMAAEGTPFRGVLFAGLMIAETEGGAEARLLEYNTRFGDPECQVLMKRLKSDLLPLLLASAEGKLAGMVPEWSDEAALCVVMAAKGYPGDVEKGSEIKGLAGAGAVGGVTVFHAATKAGPDGGILANGGRVLGVTAQGGSVRQAQARAYTAVDRLDWAAGFCRRDIGWRAVARET